MPRPGARRCGARPPHPTNRTTSVRALPIVKIEMGTGRRAGDVYSTPQGQLNTPVHWARWTVRQQLTLRRHQARPKSRAWAPLQPLSLGPLCVVSCSERARARNWPIPLPLVLVNIHLEEPRDERSRHPSLGLPRVGGEPDRGRPVFSGPVNWWRKRSGTFFSI